MAYKVLVDDNFHYMDESERYELGVFPTLEAAIEASREIVDEYLRSAYQPGMTHRGALDQLRVFSGRSLHRRDGRRGDRRSVLGAGLRQATL